MNRRRRAAQCTNCDRPMRGGNILLTDAPGTVKHGSGSLCQTCARRRRLCLPMTEAIATYAIRPANCSDCGNRLSTTRAKTDWGRRYGGNGRCARCKKIRDTYGISTVDRAAMLADQGGACASCGDPFGDTTPNVDHSHTTGRVRALLCRPCNMAEGMMQSDPRRAFALAVYMEQHEAIDRQILEGAEVIYG